MQDITVIIRHRPVINFELVGNQLAWQVDTSNYELIIREPELTAPTVNRGIREILKMETVKEKSRQHGNADSPKEKYLKLL